MMRCTHALRSLQTDHAAGTPLCLCAANSVSTRTRRHIREVHDGDGAVLKLDLDAALRFDEVPDQALVMLTQRRTTTHNDAQRRTAKQKPCRVSQHAAAHTTPSFRGRGKDKQKTKGAGLLGRRGHSACHTPHSTPRAPCAA